ncbi:MAG: PIN domain-containing protein [Candidatus Hatepunaea meridiana]|nr:PIN domain-containing protein [Candidatus Hatepunaea meridiana]
MKVVFADTQYWIAIVNPRDQWHEHAKHARETLGNFILLTTDEILIEFLNALSGKGKNIRLIAVKIVSEILNNPNVRVMPQSHDTFSKGLELYRKREDKDYSLTDCISMNVMKSESVTDVLTSDRHFKQEGFSILLTL